MLVKHIQNFIKEKNIQKILVGFSGGVDSTVLLYILSKFTDATVRAIYVNHCLSENAESWAEFCESFCYENDIKFIHEKVFVEKKNRTSLEAVAREKRYGAYRKHIQNEEVLFLGHHNDDQVETVMLQLLRGTGVSGLSGMPSYSVGDTLTIARPMILETEQKDMITKEVLELYAKENGITHIVDESNFTNDFRRNFLRNEIIPKLKEEFGNINKTISNTAIACNTAREYSDNYIYGIARDCIHGNKLLVEALQKHSDSEIKDIFRFWMKSMFNQRSTSMKKLNEITKFLKTATNDNNFQLVWGDYVIKMHWGFFFAEKKN